MKARELIRFVSPWSMIYFQKISALTTHGDHFSCRKPVSHVETSTVSDSGTHFWVHFSTSILGSKNDANFAKVFAVKAA